MSLDRKDVRAKLDADYHEALVAVSRIDGIDIGEFVERELVRVLDERLHQHIKERAEFDGLGIVGKIRETLGGKP